MATSNDKMNAIRQVISKGLELNIRQTENGHMIVSILKDGIELKYIMDKALGKGSTEKIIVGSAMVELVELVRGDWLEEV
jgi:hypothetical protein